MIKTIKYLDHEACVKITDERDHIQKHWLLDTFYEAKRNGLLSYLYETYRGELKTFYDVGASVGNHTLFFHKCMGADFVASFEPHRPSYLHLKTNVFVSRIPAARQRTYHMALGEYAARGHTELYGECNTDNDGIVSPNVGMCKFVPGAGDVPMVPLDDVFEAAAEDVPPPDFIKIDAEGYEMKIIVGATGLIEEFRPILSVEVEPEDLLPIFDVTLRSMGYRRASPRLNYTATYIYEPI